jgi:hypothetical protein
MGSYDLSYYLARPVAISGMTALKIEFEGPAVGTAHGPVAHHDNGILQAIEGEGWAVLQIIFGHYAALFLGELARFTSDTPRRYQNRQSQNESHGHKHPFLHFLLPPFL